MFNLFQVLLKCETLNIVEMLLKHRKKYSQCWQLLYSNSKHLPMHNGLKDGGKWRDSNAGTN